MAILVVLVAARAMSTICWEGSQYVLYGAWVKLFCAFWTPKNYVVFLGVSMVSLGTKSVMGAAPMDFPVPN